MKFRNLVYRSLVWRGFFLATTFLLNVAIARIFDAGGSGWIFYVTSIVAFALVLATFSLESALGFYGAGEPGKISNEKLAFLALVFTGTIVLVGGLFLSSYLPPDASYFGMDKGFFILTMLAYAGGNVLLTFFGALFYAKKDFKTPNLIPGGINILILLLAILAAQRMGGQRLLLGGYFFSFLAAGSFMTVMFLTRHCKWIWLDWPRVTEIKRLFRYSFLSLIANLVTFLLFRVDYYFVNRFCSETELGNYIQVSKVAQLFFVLPGVVAGAVFPLTAGGMKEDLRNHLLVLCRLIFYFFALACLLLAFSGFLIFPAIYGADFDKMYNAFIYMIPGILGICIIYPLTAFFAGQGKVSINIYGCFFALICMVACDLLLIPAWKINGAAIACSVSYLVYCGYIVARFRLNEGIRLIDFLKPKRSDLFFLFGGLKNRD